MLVELNSLKKEDFVNILTQTHNAITMQYSALLGVDNIDLQFKPDAIERIAEVAEELNTTSEDIGARRLHTVMEYILEEISFEAGGNDYPLVTVVIDKKYVDGHIDKLMQTCGGKKHLRITGFSSKE